MNSMHNSFSGPGGYSGAYPGYVPPPSALPYYNGYPGDVNQSSNPYYGKPGASVPPGYSSGMGTYTPPINNSSMYYQQYGLGYQYSYGKYGISSSLGYSPEIPSGSGIHPPIGTLQAPTTDLGLTGSMFSKNNKYSGNQGSSSPHTSSLSHGSNMLSPAPNTPSPGPHAISSNVRGPGATPSPPIECNEGKKDLDKMKRCQICGQVFRLMSECLAHMKAVHEAPLSVYSLHHTAGGHVTQSLSTAPGIPPHSLAGGLSPSTSRHASMATPDSPLMALERMGWGEKQNLMPSSPLTTPSSYVSTSNPQHTPSVQHSHHQSSSANQPQIYGSTSHQHSLPVQHQSRILQSPVQRHSPSSHPSPVQHPSPAPQLPPTTHNIGVNQSSPVAVNTSEASILQPSNHPSQADLQHPNSLGEEVQSSATKHRKTNSYSMSSIIGETRDIESIRNKSGLGGSLSGNEAENLHSVTSEIKSTGALEQTFQSRDSANESSNLSLDNCKQNSSDDKGKNTTSEIVDTNTSSDISSNVQLGTTGSGTNEIAENDSKLPLLEDRSKLQIDSELADDDKSPQSSLVCEEEMKQCHSNDSSMESTHKKEFVQSTLIVGKKDLIREMQASNNSQQIEASYMAAIKKEECNSSSIMAIGAQNSKNQDPSNFNNEVEMAKHEYKMEKGDLKKSVNKCSENTNSPSSKHPSQVLNADQQHVMESHDSPSAPQSHTSQQQSQHLSPAPPQQSQHHRHPSPPVGMYHNQNSMKTQAGYGGWPMPLGPNYSGQYPYPCPQGGGSQPGVGAQQPNSLAGNICSKPHGYPMHPRFASQYHQAGPPGSQYPPSHEHVRVPGPHNYMQGHPQNLSSSHSQNLSSGHPQNLSSGHPQNLSSGHPQNLTSGHPQNLSSGHPQNLSSGHPQNLSSGHPQNLSSGHPQNLASGHPQSLSSGHPQSLPSGHPQNIPSGHPQSNWFPPRSESKAMWGSWPNQGGQPYHQSFYGYPNQAPGQKHLHHQPHSGPPPAHVHPSPVQPSHMHNMSHQHTMSQTQKPQMLHCSPASQNMTPNQQSSSKQSQQSTSYPVSPLDIKKEQCQTAPSSSSPIQHIESSESSPQPVDPQPVDPPPVDLPILQNEKVIKGEQNMEGGFQPDLTDSPIHSTTVPVAQNANSSPNNNQVVLLKKSGPKIGPKSKVMSEKQINQLEDLDNYKCLITIKENGSLNGYTSQGSSGTCGHQSSDSSDSEVAIDDGPVFTLLKPAKRKFRNAGRDGIFVGPKRIKLAKQVWERKERRQRNIQEQIRQSELEEQLQAERIELADGQTGPLGNILLQSSILLSDKKVEESDCVEECIANIKAEHQPFNENSYDADGYKSFSPGGHYSNSASKKPGRRSQTKVFHNEHSVRIQDKIPLQLHLRKLRAKDFKWSHYIKSMRYWCSDCAHGFKNNKEVTMHNEESCKWNCLYMLECYVIVKDIQTHPTYGPKVQELLEEYQIDGDHQCVTCSEVIARKADFLVHVDSHKDFMPWECTICGTRFKIRGSLKEHLRYTHMKGRVPCLKCNKVFPTSTLLRQHVKVHTQHYKYKSTKNREEELRAAMEATAGALEVPMGTTSPEDNEKLSNEANEYRNWCKLMEMNALKNLSTPGTMGGSSAGGSIGDEEDDDGRDVDGSGDEMGGIGDNLCSESPKHCSMSRSFSESKAEINS